MHLSPDLGFKLKNYLNVPGFKCARIKLFEDSCVLGLKASQPTSSHIEQKKGRKRYAGNFAIDLDGTFCMCFIM